MRSLQRTLAMRSLQRTLAMRSLRQTLATRFLQQTLAVGSLQRTLAVGSLQRTLESHSCKRRSDLRGTASPNEKRVERDRSTLSLFFGQGLTKLCGLQCHARSERQSQPSCA